MTAHAPLQKHPKLLYVLCMTEVWERFSYYLMVGLFTIYLVDKLNVPEGEAFQLYGNFTALVYLCPLLGGFLADRFLGYRWAIILGATCMATGYFSLASIAYQATNITYSLYVALFIIAFGNGLFKPNISTMVGNLYPQGDGRRDSAFSIFYMGINIGAFLGPQIGSLLRDVNWGYAFAAAGGGMLLSGIIFLAFLGRLKSADLRSSVSAILQISLPKEYQDPPEPHSVERNRIISIFVLSVVVMFFWMAFHQKDTSLTFWAKNTTDLTLGGLFPHGINPERFASINPFFILTLTPVIVWFHGRLRKKGKEISTPTKIGVGMLLVALAFGVMIISSLLGGDAGHKMSALWLVGTYFIITVGELYLSPMGLSLITKLSPARMVGAMMGVWFLATSLGNKLVGSTGKYWWKTWPHHQFFAFLVVCSLAAAAVMFCFVPFMKRAIPQGPK